MGKPATVDGLGAPGQRVDGEVAPGEVVLDRLAELHPRRSAEVGVVDVRPEGRHLVGATVAADRHRSEAVLVERIGEDCLDLVRPRVRGQVPVRGRALQEIVPKRTAHDVRAVTGRPEGVHQLPDRLGNREPRFEGVPQPLAARAGRRFPHGRPRQFRPRNRYDRQASFRSSAR